MSPGPRRAALLPLLSALLSAAGCALLRPAPEPPRPLEPPPVAVGNPNAAPGETTGSPGKMLVYSAITGHVPVRDQTPAALTGPAREAARAAALEAEIQEELDRQEALRGRIEEQQTQGAQASALAAGQPLEATPNPLIAPGLPEEREIPLSMFDALRTTVPAGAWGNDEELDVVRRGLDVDGDGRDEEVRWFDGPSGRLLRVEQDLNYDGRMDVVQRYENGSLAERVADSSGDGTTDLWESYAHDRLTERTIDRDDDGVRDAYYRYEGDVLVEERHDANNDGSADLVVTYEKLRRISAQEDRDGDGVMDTWTTYQNADGRDVVARVERDSKGQGRADVVETFEVDEEGQVLLARREEDVDGDGAMDVVSIYEKGKLVQRRISDPELAPL